MDDTARVRRRKPLGNARNQRAGEFRLEGAQLIERAPLDVGQHHEQPARVLLDAVDRADVGMVERGEGAGLTLEARARLGIRREVGMDELEGDLAVKLEVMGEPDLAHAAGAELALDAEVTDRRAEHARENTAMAEGPARFPRPGHMLIRPARPAVSDRA